MTRCLVLVLVALLASSSPASADPTATAQSRGFRPLWTAVGAGAGFGLGAWIGLTKFDDAIDSDRKVWTTAIVSAAAGGILGFLLDRHQARSAHPSRIEPFVPVEGLTPAWRKAIYGSSTSPATVRLPAVQDLILR